VHVWGITLDADARRTVMQDQVGGTTREIAYTPLGLVASLREQAGDSTDLFTAAAYDADGNLTTSSV
jgi:hypothetical protein